jgi:hypothetical protein
VYLTLGNIPRSLRRRPSEQACVLIAYLPVEKIDEEGFGEKEISGRYMRLFHECMAHITNPLILAGQQGIQMTSADGSVRLVFPILASYVADHPEQCLVSCSKQGTCPKCRISHNTLNSPTPAEPRTHDWTLGVMQAAQSTCKTSNQYFKYCMKREVSGYVYKPFWVHLPYTDIHLSITPDILHQLYQGIFRRLISWCQAVLTPSELDNRIRCLPPAIGVRHFPKGFSILSQVTGPEHKHMARILLGCLIGSDMSNQGVRACRALLDFIYLAQYPSHDSSSLTEMETAIQAWHSSSNYFVEIGAHPHLNIPKFHSILHYADSIRCFGTTDNYNTEMFERLHIDFAKQAWRASNKRDGLPQMTAWINRHEKILLHERYLTIARAALTAQRMAPEEQITDTSLPAHQTIFLPKHPPAPNSTLDWVATTFKLPDFRENLRHFLSHFQDRTPKEDYATPFSKIDVFYSFKLSIESLDTEGASDTNTVKATPLAQGRYDTVVVLTDNDAQNIGIQGTVRPIKV